MCIKHKDIQNILFFVYFFVCVALSRYIFCVCSSFDSLSCAYAYACTFLDVRGSSHNVI